MIEAMRDVRYTGGMRKRTSLTRHVTLSRVNMKNKSADGRRQTSEKLNAVE